MELGKAFGFDFDDEQWLSKILIGGLVLLIPVIGTLAAYGYILATARNVVMGRPRPLADWNEFGDILMKGLMWFLISLGYGIPLVVLILVVFFGAGLIGASLDASGGEITSAISMVLFLSMIAFIFIASLLVNLLIGIATVRYVQTDSLGEAFQLGAVWSMLLAAPGTWVMLLLGSILAGIAATVGLLACGVGVLFTSIYAYGVIGHLTGQAARQFGSRSGAAPLPSMNTMV